MPVIIKILLSNVFISTISFIGVLPMFLGTKKKIFSSVKLVSFSAGVLLATAFVNILPEALEAIDVHTGLLFVLFGMVIAFLMERSLLWYHHHHDDLHDHKPVAQLVIFGDSVHNFIDGMAIAATFIVNPGLGFMTTLAIAAHEIPQELADFSILLHCGISKKKALLYNFLSALTAVLGGFVGFYFFRETPEFIHYALALTAGIFIYVASADLIPELHTSHNKDGGIQQTVLFLCGIALMYFIATLVPHS